MCIVFVVGFYKLDNRRCVMYKCLCGKEVSEPDVLCDECVKIKMSYGSDGDESTVEYNEFSRI